MVEYDLQLNDIFGSLADPTRRDILQRLERHELNIGEVAANYDVSLAAISKHLKILERARLIVKRKQGKEHYVTILPAGMQAASQYFEQYERLWKQRLDRLEEFLKENI